MRIGWLLLWMLCTGSAWAAQEARLELLDGSTLRGEIVGLEGGRYRVRTRHLGVVELPESEIRSLSFGPAAASGGPGVDSGAASGAAGSQLQAVQRGLMSDEGTMMMIMELAEDPQFQAILADPELMRAVTAGDLGALANHPAITRLMSDPRIQAIGRQSGMTGGR